MTDTENSNQTTNHPTNTIGYLIKLTECCLDVDVDSVKKVVLAESDPFKFARSLDIRMITLES